MPAHHKCRMKGCRRLQRNGGLCGMHYQRKNSGPDMDAAPGTIRSDLAAPLFPRITNAGSYHPADLMDYLDFCRDAGVKDFQIADALGLPTDRIIYAMGAGRHLFERRATEVRLIERAAA